MRAFSKLEARAKGVLRNAAWVFFAMAFNIVVPSVRLANAAETDALKHFKAGEQAYRRGDFEEAVAHYQRAYDLYRAPAFLFNLGRAHQELGQCDQARSFFRRYLAADSNPEKRESAERRIGALGACEDRPQITPGLEPTRVRVEIPAPPAELTSGASPWPWLAMGTGVAASIVGSILIAAYQPSVENGRRNPYVRKTKVPGIITLSSGIGFAALGAVLFLLDDGDGGEGQRLRVPSTNAETTLAP